MIGLAHLGGPIACLGLALLLVAKTRRERIAGLAFAAFGACVLGAALASTWLSHRAAIASARAYGTVLEAIGDWLSEERAT